MTASARPIAKSSWVDVVTIVMACEAIACAIWLLPASVRIVAWPASGPVRVALFGSGRSLMALGAGGLIAGALTAIAAQRIGTLSRLATFVRPLLLLWLWAVPYAPWLPDRMPALLVLAGPLRWLVVVAAGIVACGGRIGLPRSDALPVPGRKTIFATSLALYLAAGLASATALGPGGDEPHYLVITQSLLLDHDLQIENNHARGDYRRYFHADLRPDYYVRGTNGQIYSIHAPGLPALAVPAFAIGGYLGVVVFMGLLSALMALAVFDLAMRLTGERAALIAWAAACLTVPVVPQAWLVFPEVPGALITAWSALWLFERVDPGPNRWFWRGLALSLLPWLHTKFVILLACFGAALVLRSWRRPRSMVAFVVPIAVSGALWLYSFYAIYGVFDPQVPYGAFTETNMRLENIPRGMLGLLVDQKFGLLFYSPIYLLAAAGAWVMIRRPERRFEGLALLATIGVYLVSTTRLYMWWGGSSAPARFLMPIVPCLAPMIAVAAERTRAVAARALTGVWLSLSVGVAAAAVLWPRRLIVYSVPHGQGRLLEMLQGPAPLTFLVPTFTEQDWHAPLMSLVPWLLAAGVGVFAVTVASRRSRSCATLVVVGVLAFVATGAAAARTPAPEVRDEIGRRGAIDLVWTYDPSSLRPFDFARMQKASPERLSQLGTIVVRRPPGEPLQKGQPLAGPFNLPAGEYEARIWFTGAAAHTGALTVSASDRAVVGQVSGALPNPAVVAFTLPVSARRLSVATADPGLGSAVSQVELRPTATVPPGARETFRTQAIESLAGRPGAYVMYTDDSAFPEGGVFWTRGTERATVVVAPAGASRIVLTLYPGPSSGDVVVTANGEDRRVPVVSGQARQVVLDAQPGQRLVSIGIQAPGMFRPSDVDPTSADQRRLGCQVRIGLE